MKKLTFMSIGFVALLGIVLFSTNGCGARGKVAMDNVMNTVDKLLGELKVKRQKISDKMDALETGIKGIRKSRIETEVQREMLQKKVEDQEAKKADADKNLKKLSDLLKKAKDSSSDVVKTEGGKEIKKATLDEVAKKLMSQQKTITTKLKGFQEAESTLARVVKTLNLKEKEYSDTLDRLKHALEQIDAKQKAAEAMQAASKKIDGDDSLKDSIAKLESDIEELNVTVETSLRLEDDKWVQSEHDAEVQDAMKTIQNSGGDDDLINQIDNLLKED